jgi:hypothetical protein
MSILEQIAPTIATALLGPAGNIAISLVSKALGIDEKDVQSTIESGKLTSDQLASIKQAEIELKAKAQELGLNFEKLATDDRKSAREMQVSTKSFVPALLSVLIVVGWSMVQYFLLTHIIAQEMRELVARVLGTLDGALMLVLGFYFGGIHNASETNEMLHRSTPQ